MSDTEDYQGSYYMLYDKDRPATVELIVDRNLCVHEFLDDGPRTPICGHPTYRCRNAAEVTEVLRRRIAYYTSDGYDLEEKQ